ncbi:ROK family protein [Xylanimonas cellulosilytica DSM 15894]|uniref:ROK family protein n=1 Tax=Xylanimonas cellulosilytica (strain DSM 15894 / JCM 12276 / CECT 5975 / KCTC 9989 / LMG 20990 / NBRC 107835 / XIL07) TaxID=446471 RepID=D1BUR5_XYLCX|nr:ROK family protein [Xylanimonas cellulosilytica]ACZ29306.1 ROK family protein [Xylanimonas cellulosilytica DSM 15894]
MQGSGAGHANARSTIIDAVRAAGVVSRTGIVQATGLTGATVSKEVRALLDEGLLVESGTAPSTGGRSQVLLQLQRASRYAAGLHLDHDGVTAVLLDLGGAVVAEQRMRWVGAAEPAVVVDSMIERLGAMLRGVGAERERLLGIGVVAPGPVTPGEGIVASRPALREWVRFPFAERLSRTAGLPVIVDNDATASAVGELWTGGARGSNVFTALYMATGIGSGTVVDGVPYRGASLTVGEIGHVCIDLAGPECWCGNVGCLEAVAGPSAVVAEGRAAGLMLPERLTVAEAFAEVVSLARRGDGVAVDIVQRSAQHLAVAAQTLCTLMAVDLVVLTGASFGVAGDLYLPTVRERVRSSFLAHASGTVRVEVSQQARRAPAVGAAALVLQDALVPRSFSTRLALPSAEPSALVPGESR